MTVVPQDLEAINKILKQAFLVLPHYCLGRGLLDMAAAHVRAEVMGRFGESSVCVLQLTIIVLPALYMFEKW